MDTVGRVVHPHKRGTIASHAPPLLQRLGMDAEAFIACADTFFRTFAHAVGIPANAGRCAAWRRHGKWCVARLKLVLYARLLHDGVSCVARVAVGRYGDAAVKTVHA